MNRQNTLRSLMLLGVGVSIVLTGWGGGSGGDSGASPEVAKGQTLFRSTCATCHGQSAEGIPALGKDLHGNTFVADNSVEELAAFFAEGRPANHPDNERKIEMPPKGGNVTLTDEHLRLIAVYVKSLE